MAQVPVGVDQFANADLLELVLGGDFRADPLRARPQPIAAQPLKVLHHRAVWHVGGHALDHRQMLEVAAPLLGDAVRIVQVGLVERFDVGIAGGELGFCPHPLYEGVGHPLAGLHPSERHGSPTATDLDPTVERNRGHTD